MGTEDWATRRDVGEEHRAMLVVHEYEESVAMPTCERLVKVSQDGLVRRRKGVSGNDVLRRAEDCARWIGFGYDVDEASVGAMPRSEGCRIDGTSDVLQGVGLAAEQIVYTQRHLEDALRSEDLGGHGLTPAQVKRIPELLERPVMMFDSNRRDDALVVALCSVDRARRPVIVALLPGGEGVTHGRVQESTIMLSAYGKSNAESYFQRLTGAGSLLYFDMERGRELEALAGLQLPQSLFATPGLDRKIIRRARAVGLLEADGGYGNRSVAEERDRLCAVVSGRATCHGDRGRER